MVESNKDDVKDEHLTFRLSSDLKDRIKRMADRDDMDVAPFIRKMIRTNPNFNQEPEAETEREAEELIDMQDSVSPGSLVGASAGRNRNG
jgi:predicted transcriptional regulator